MSWFCHTHGKPKDRAGQCPSCQKVASAATSTVEDRPTRPSPSSWVQEEALRLWSRYRSTGEFGAPEASIDDYELSDLAGALSHASDLAAAVRQLQDLLKQEMASRIGQGHAYRTGDIIYRVSPKRKIRVEDPRGLAEFLGSDVAKVFRLDGSNFRKRGLKEVAKSRDLEERTVRETFGIHTEESDDLALQSMPAEKAPKFLQGLADGELS